jgi:cell division protein FtsL
VAQNRKNNRTGQERKYSRSYSFAPSTPYVEGSTAPAYEEIEEGSRLSNLHFWQGGKKDLKTSEKKAPDGAKSVLKIVGYAISMLLVVGVITVSFNNNTQILAQEAQSIQTSITSAREAGKSSEVQLGLLSNPTRIKEKAEEMGMQAATNPITINLSDDAVVLDGNGNIALAGSLAAISSN